MIVGINAMLLAFAFLFAGIMSLASQSTAELDAQRKAYEEARAKSWLHALIFSLGQAASAKNRSWLLAISHWPERPHCRQLVYTGTACLLVAAAIGHHFGVFSS